MVTLLALLLLAAIWLAQYVAGRIKLTSMLARVPGPGYPLPLLGNLLHMFGPMDSIMDRGIHLYELYGPGPIKFWIGEWPSVQVRASYNTTTVQLSSVQK